MVINEPNPENSPRNELARNGQRIHSMSTSRFRSLAAMAGWDEDAFLIAGLVVEDTPDRDSKQKKPSDVLFKTPPTNSRRERTAQMRTPVSVDVPVLDLEDETSKESEKKKIESKKAIAGEEKKTGEQELTASSSNLPCMDRLREELSCSICLDICFEPSTTSCGHSFCKKCLRSAAQKCGKRCPKCRQLISNGRSCTVNTVLWNTIQLLFPQEIEATKTSNCRGNDEKSPPPTGSSHYNVRNRSIRALNSPDDNRLQRRRRRVVRVYRDVRRGVPSHDEDTALSLRFMDVFREFEEQYSSSVSLARENLRAMTSRAMDIHVRRRPWR